MSAPFTSTDLSKNFVSLADSRRYGLRQAKTVCFCRQSGLSSLNSNVYVQPKRAVHSSVIDRVPPATSCIRIYLWIEPESKGRQSQPLGAFYYPHEFGQGVGRMLNQPEAGGTCAVWALFSLFLRAPPGFTRRGLDHRCASLWPSGAESGAPRGSGVGGSRGGARAAVGRAPAGWRLAQPRRLCRPRRPAGFEPLHASLCPTPSLCVPASPRPRVSASRLPQDDAHGERERGRGRHAYRTLRPLPGALAAEAQPARGERAPWVPRAQGAEPGLGRTACCGTSSVCSPVPRGLPSGVLSLG